MESKKMSELENTEVENPEVDNPEVADNVTDGIENVELTGVGEEGDPEKTETHEVEAWQLEEDVTLKDNNDSSVPTKTHIKVKTNLKRRLKEGDSEIKRLREENERLKGQTLPEVKTGKPVRPNELDFETDEAFRAAQEKYDSDIIQYHMSERDSTQKEVAAQEAKIMKIQADVDSHFERADNLIKTSGISEEKYEMSNLAIRKAIDSIAPDNGDAITDALISTLGEGSEKVFYHLGINSAAQGEFIGLLASDPTGLQAAIYLGKKSVQLNSPAPKKSKAPAPAPTLSGGGATLSGDKLRKIKREARKTHKIDTTKW
jgi:hypothetical protein